MKKILLTLVAVTALGATVFGQGQVNMSNPSATPITLSDGQNNLGAMPLRSTSLFVSVLMMDYGSGFQPQLYRTNSNTQLGVISAASFVSVPLGNNIPYYIATWSDALGGADYALVLSRLDLTDPLNPVVSNEAYANLFYGRTTVGSVTPSPGAPTTPPLLFGTLAGQVAPHVLYQTVGAVPEPSTFALAGLGLAGLLIFRRRK